MDASANGSVIPELPTFPKVRASNNRDSSYKHSKLLRRLSLREQEPYGFSKKTFQRHLYSVCGADR